MDVRDLIVELLEADMDSTVGIYVKSSHEDDSFDFTVIDDSTYRKSLSLEVDLEKYVLVDKRDFEDMENEIDALKEELEDLRNE